MKIRIFFIILVMLNSLIFAEVYYDNFGIEFETGTQEKTDVLTETLDDYYDYYKNNLFMKFIDNDSGAETSLKIENGMKDYVDDSLDNRFHFLSADYTQRMAKLLFFNCGVKAGPVISQKNSDYSYSLFNVSPKFILKFDSFEVFSGFIVQNKDYGNADQIQSLTLSFGLNKQFSQESSLALDFGTKEIQQRVDDVESEKNSKYAKIGYYWQR